MRGVDHDVETIMDVTEATFKRDVLDRSNETPVVVDFWAAWCGPCRTLGPVLEKLAAEAQGAWTLAKVDVDSNQRLSAAAGVQGIPAVRAFKDGKQVAEFTGALPEAQVRQWLSQLGPSPADIAFDEAAKLEAAGDLEAAAEGYRRVLGLDPTHAEAKAAVARLELELRALATDVAAMEERLASNPADVEAAVAVADSYALQGRLEDAFGRLLDVVATSQGEDRDKARRHLLALLDTVPPDDGRAIEARRKLSRLLF